MSNRVLSIHPSWTGFGWAIARAKFSYRLGQASPEPLSHGLRGGPIPERSDFVPWKERTDVIVEGFAYARGRSTREGIASIQVGAACRNVRVLGPRAWHRAGSRWMVGDPQYFDRVALTNENAYGGVDLRVRLDDETSFTTASIIDHPGLYPRNRTGKGYAIHEPYEGLELPQLEDPEDPLRLDRPAAVDPRHWHSMPLPCSLDWQGPLTFPRCLYFGLNAWFPAPDINALAEVRRGRLTPQGLPSSDALLADPRYHQEAQPGMTLPCVSGGEEVVLLGMHPSKLRVELRLPEPPRIAIGVDRDQEDLEVRAQTLVLRPDLETFSITWAARRPLPRAFLPGIHRDRKSVV